MPAEPCGRKLKVKAVKVINMEDDDYEIERADYVYIMSTPELWGRQIYKVSKAVNCWKALEAYNRARKLTGDDRYYICWYCRCIGGNGLKSALLRALARYKHLDAACTKDLFEVDYMSLMDIVQTVCRDADIIVTAELGLALAGARRPQPIVPAPLSVPREWL